MAFNVIPIGGDDGESDAGGSDDEDDLVQYKLKQKVACCNSIIRAIRTIGAPCFNSSAVTEKNHIGVNHALRLSKGKNKMANSLRQVTRLGFLRIREVRTQDEEAEQIAREEQEREEIAADRMRAAFTGKSAVMRNFGRGVDSKAKALQGMSPKAIARMCHCIREHMGALCEAARTRDREGAGTDADLAQIQTELADTEVDKADIDAQLPRASLSSMGEPWLFFGNCHV